MNSAVVNVNSFIGIRRIGFEALKNALGPVGVTRFIQQFENGSGDYTKEKYSQPDLTLEELDVLLRSASGVLGTGMETGSPDMGG